MSIQPRQRDWFPKSCVFVWTGGYTRLDTTTMVEVGDCSRVHENVSVVAFLWSENLKIDEERIKVIWISIILFKD